MTLKAQPDVADAGATASQPTAVDVKFTGVVLVCGDCEARGNGPRKLRARDVRKALKREIHSHDDGKAARCGLRIVQSACLGLCPKKALTLVAVRCASETPLAVAATSADEAAAFGRRLVELGRS
jgi:hypothetical protein